MSDLTDEQRRMIEKKRLEAQQRLKEAKRKAAVTIQSTHNTAPPKIECAPLQAVKKYPPSAKMPIVTGTFTLLSTERFIVDVHVYHPQMIQVFKSMTTNNYDFNQKKWNFSIDEHDKLNTAIKPLRPEVCISPLPEFVREALKSLAKQVPSSCVDLFGLEPKILDSLFPFQHEGVCFGVSRNGRCLFADDMGLGKTIQALGVAAYYRTEWPLLVITPSSVRYTWVNAIERWMPSVSREDITVIGSGQDPLTDSEVVIMTYDLLVRKLKEVLNRNFQVVIMDESHMMKNYKTARYKAAAPVIKRAKRVLMLTGTPALSRPSELYTQIAGLCPHVFPSFQNFGVRYCNGKQFPWGWDFSGSSNLKELEIMLETIMIRRLKTQVLDQLPSKQRMTVTLDPTSVENGTKSLAAAAKKFGLKSVSGGEKQGALLAFFNETAKAKLNAVSVYIKELLESDKRFLVFAHHQVMLDKLSNTCDIARVRHIRIDGKTSPEMRQKLVTRFQEDDTVRVAVLSITAANTGLTLTSADLVIFAELFWNPGDLVQAEDRAHRIGQESCVMVQYLVARGTADDYLWSIIQSKMDVLNEVGLAKDNFSNASSTYQKKTGEDSIVKYFNNVKTDDISEDSTDEPKTKKQKT